MKLIDQLERDLARVGASLDPDRDWTLNCDAPCGYVWAANGCRTITIQWATNRQTWLVDALKNDGLPRLRMGLRKVTDQTELAAMRHDLGDDTWGAPAGAPETIEWPK